MMWVSMALIPNAWHIIASAMCQNALLVKACLARISTSALCAEVKPSLTATVLLTSPSGRYPYCSGLCRIRSDSGKAMVHTPKPRLTTAIRHLNNAMSKTTNGTRRPPKACPLSTMPVAVAIFLRNQLATAGIITILPPVLMPAPIRK